MIQYPLVEGYLKLKGISIPEMCKELNITQRTWNNKISGRSDFTLPEATAIAEKAERPINEIFLQNNVSQTIR